MQASVSAFLQVPPGLEERDGLGDTNGIQPGFQAATSNLLSQSPRGGVQVDRPAADRRLWRGQGCLVRG